eukprot:2565553-Rhodomonas_salina.2
MDQDTYCPSYRWGQTETQLVITIDVNEECVESHNVTPDGQITVRGEVPGKGKFELFLDLDGTMLAGDVDVQVLPRTLRLRLKKKEAGVRWKRLQKEGIAKPAQEKMDFDFYMNSSDSEEDEGGWPSSIPASNDHAAIAEQIKKKMAEAGVANKTTSPQTAAPAPSAPPSKQHTMLFGLFLKPDGWDIFLLVVALFHIYMAPFPSIEESFNLEVMSMAAPPVLRRVHR